MQLYYYDTLNPRLACAVARHLDAPVEYRYVDLGKGEHRRPEYLALNPNGKVPTLVDGATKLWEAPAIGYHLAAKSGSDFLPTDAAGHAELLRWINWTTAHFWRHTGRLYFQRVIKPKLGLGEPDPAEIEEASGYVVQFGKVLDGHLRGRRYLIGDRLTLADFVVATSLPAMTVAKFPLDDFAEIGRWYAQLEALPAWRDPFPQRQAAAA